jgi:hypothetical protein
VVLVSIAALLEHWLESTVALYESVRLSSNGVTNLQVMYERNLHPKGTIYTGTKRVNSQ